MFPTVLVMLALDRRDEALVEAMRAAAGRLGVRRVLALHVHPVDPFPDALAGHDRPDPERPGALDAAMEALADATGVEVVGLHAVGEPRKELSTVLEREDVDLLVLGRRAGDGRHVAWGPSGLKILRHATCPVLLVPEGSRLDLEHGVAGMDFSYEAIEGLRAAAALCDEVDAVFQYDLRAVGTGAMTAAEFHAAFAENARRHFDEMVRPRLPAGARVRLRTVEGRHAHEVLVREAGDWPIFVGSRGLSGLAAALLGSVAEQVAGTARGPALIWRPKGVRLGLLEALAHR